MNYFSKFVSLTSILFLLSIVLKVDGKGKGKGKNLARCHGLRKDFVDGTEVVVPGLCVDEDDCFYKSAWIQVPQIEYDNTSVPCPGVYFLIEVKLKKSSWFVVYLSSMIYRGIQILLVDQRIVSIVDRLANSHSVTLSVAVEGLVW
jgi:hypothetical protein